METRRSDLRLVGTRSCAIRRGMANGRATVRATANGHFHVYLAMPRRSAQERVPTRSEEMQQNRLIIPYLYIEK